MSKNNNFIEKYGPWALVTGASSGIGKEFAHQLAAKGMNVVVVARRQERLEAIVEEIERNYPVQARALPVDLTASDYLDVIIASTADIDIGLLVNNAGAGVPGAFLTRDLEDHTKTVELNVTAPMQLAHKFGRIMAQRGRGGIIFVSSLGTYMGGTPFMSNYIATKGYLLNLGTSLHVEMKPKGVDVLVLSPGPTRTEMVEFDGIDFSGMPMNWMNVSPVVKAGLNGLGRRASVVPGLMNKIMAFAGSRLIPRQQALSMFGWLMSKSMDSSLL